MAAYYGKRALEILQKEGPTELSKASVRFILRKIDPKYNRYFTMQTSKNNLINRIRYEAPPAPYRTIQIRPSEIEHRVGRNKPNRKDESQLKQIKTGGIARTKGGEWDSAPHCIDVEEIDIINGVIQRFEKGMDWNETDYYQYISNSCDQQNIHKKRGFEEAVDYLQTRFEKYDELFRDIKNNGYQPGHTGSHVVPGKSQPIRSQLEVLVTIDRHGKVNFFEGNHRFGIARVLDISIPAHVVCRHKMWQNTRDEIYKNGFSNGNEGLRDHPDLQDIVD